ncbi:hypothetical protein AURDEDRAFT_182952 [Auricularia subglabra TFB-10046 SS5]|nr:hypothetical protein AURDEDRAFT_182952 [Auricularia subglabra TFB-10046 SS5]
MDALARRLSDGLVDPNRPAICPICADVDFGEFLNRNVRDATVRSLRKNHHEFLKRIMVFLTTPQTAARDRNIKQHMRRCPNRGDLEHELITDWEFGHAGYLAAFLCDVVGPCLLYSRGLTTQRFGTNLWPTSPKDLMPFGPAQTFKCLMHWLATEDSANIASTLTGVMAYVRRDFMAELESPSIREEFVSAICHQLETAAAEEIDLDGDEWDGPGDRRPAYRISCLGILLQLIATGPGSQADSLPALVRGFESKFLDALLCARDASPPGLTKEQLRLFASTIYEAQGTPLRRMPADIREYTLDSLEAQDNPYRRLFNQIFTLRNNIGCATPGCTVHPQDVPGGKLQRCGACKLVQYCSRECQKRHWKAAEYPHKRVCVQLKDLQVDVPLGTRIESYDEFMDTCENVLTAEEADKLAMQIGPIAPPR